MSNTPESSDIHSMGAVGIRIVAPYGTWPSPVTAELVARQAATYDAVQVASDAVYWLESRPEEAGRTALVRWTPSQGCADAVPPGFDVGNRVHEYDGGAYLATDTVLFVCCLDDDRIHRVDPGQPPRPITPPAPEPRSVRYADLRQTSDERWLVCVRERHEGQEVINDLVALPTDGSAMPQVLDAGHDFYASPRPSPDSRRLAWLTWDRPQMPWDGSDLWVADLDPDRHLGRPRHVAGGPAESIVQPEWDGDRALYFLSDRSGWWNIYRERERLLVPLLPMEAEFADAPWEFDYSTYVLLGQGRIACRYRQEGIDHLAILDVARGRLDPLEGRFTSIKPYLRGTAERLAFIAASPTSTPAVVTTDPSTGRFEILAGGGSPVSEAFISRPQPITFATSDSHRAHALYYPPTNPAAAGPDGDRPPLLVQPHPGPTSDATARLDLRTQYFTSRGFAVVVVNYGGSTGYGRVYRERLNGRWGVTDVEDCTAAVHHLVAAGRVDPSRVVISGASAGGFTALCALTTHEVYAAGTSYFGITDLEAFRQQAPKFQAHELDRLVGPYPQAAATYRARSPVHHVDQLRRPVLLVQGLDDTVVSPAQTLAMADALRRRGMRHELLVFPGEGHGLRRPDNCRQALETELAFYDAVFTGREEYWQGKADS